MELTKPTHSLQKLLQRNSNSYFFLLLLLSTFLIFLFYIETDHFQFREHGNQRFYLNTGKQLSTLAINTSKCKIRQYEPFGDDVFPFFKPERYQPCSDHPLLSYIEQAKGAVSLNINQTLLSTYSFTRIRCCYSNVTRRETPEGLDNEIRVSTCVPFDKKVLITEPVVMVVCHNFWHYKIYSNVHAIISPSLVPNITSPRSQDLFNVLLVGIDSMSNISLIRNMPETYNFLLRHNFYPLKGYTKIGLNTLPNLGAILTGLTKEQLGKSCDYENKVDECAFIWDNFRRKGYVTGYGEDRSSISTFNYEKRGFQKPPTDFYFRPYVLAAESLKGLWPGRSCTGPEHESERVLNLAKDFLVSLREYPKFGLFWVNSFSHDDLNGPTRMDAKISQFLGEITELLGDTIMVFFSDHGFRFGGFRQTDMGWFEERTPYFYVHLPVSFRERHPEKYANFLFNTNQLTTPFDVYHTLTDILEESGQTPACPRCNSLFEKLPDRSCAEAGIDPNWCVCNSYKTLNSSLPLVSSAGELLVSEINSLVRNTSQGFKCEEYVLGQVMKSSETQLGRIKELLLTVVTYPEAHFEGFVAVAQNQRTLKVVGDVERLDRYAPHSKCVQDPSLERLCYCSNS